MKKKIASAITNVVLGIFALVAAIPFIYMFLTSFRQVYTLTDTNFKLSEMSLKNYATLFTNFPFFQYFANSTIVVVLSCLIVLIVSAMAGYGFAKKKFRGKKFTFSLFLATMMIPGQVTIIPIFILFKQASLLNTYAALILPNVGAFGVFLMKQFMEGLPDDLIEAARIDGCGEIRTFCSIILPLIKPVTVSLMIFTFIGVWNDFIWPLVVVSTDNMNTLTLGLSVLQGQYKTNYGLVMAGATVTFFVPFVLYISLQKLFVEGIALSGIKG